MSDVPIYFRFFIDDYLRDAQELSLMRTGAYLKLMLWYYGRAKPIPNDLVRIYARIGAHSTEEREASKYVLSEFFLLRDGFWHHKRIDEEIEHWRYRSSEAKTAVIAREKLKQIKITNTSNDDRTMIERSSNQNQNQNQKNLKSKTMSSSAKETPPNIDAARLILEFLNQKTGRQYRTTAVNLDFIRARFKEGYTERELRAVVARKCREWKGDDKMDRYLRPATLFSRTNFAQYVGEVPKETEDGPALS